MTDNWPPLSTARGVPAGLPFEIRPRHRRLVLPFLSLITCCGVLPYGAFGAIANLNVGGTAGSYVALNTMLVVMGVLCLVLPMAGTAFAIWRIVAYGGTYLAANPDGVWIRTRPWSRTAIWVPWAEIPLVQLRGLLWAKSIIFRVRDDDFAIALTFADTRADVAMARLAELSAGRSRFVVRPLPT